MIKLLNSLKLAPPFEPSPRARVPFELIIVEHPRTIDTVPLIVRVSRMVTICHIYRKKI